MNKHALISPRIFIAFLLAVATLAVYGQVRHFEFVGYDDSLYISLASKDLSWKSFVWAFTTLDFANWHPLTWLSLILDYNLYGSDASGYHITNLVFHIANTVLLFFLLHTMTGTLYRSAFVAALFALHPLHVESVAWVSERKDVLSAFFWILTLRFYVSYARDGGGLRYASVLALFAAGLAAKPMLVTLPFVLWLLDYWPLRRIDWGQEAPLPSVSVKSPPPLLSLIVEKGPLLLLSLSSSIITYVAQKQYHAVIPFDKAPPTHRLLNAFNAYANYLEDTFMFQDLEIFYPYPQSIDFGEAGFSLFLIASITALAIFRFRKAPYLPVGWFWFLGTLVPVIGIIQVGFQARADRYTYIPLIGIFIVLSWGMTRIFTNVRFGKRLAIFTALFFICFAGFTAYHQTGIWKNNISFFGHVIRYNPRSHVAYHILGHTMARSGEPAMALHYYHQTLKIKPDYDPAYINAGNVLQDLGRLDEAMNCYIKAAQFNPRSDTAEYNIGIILLMKERPEEAIRHFNRALGINPNNGDAYNNLGIAFMKTGNARLALAAFRSALRAEPGNEIYRKNLTVVESAATGIPPENLK